MVEMAELAQVNHGIVLNNHIQNDLFHNVAEMSINKGRSL